MKTITIRLTTKEYEEIKKYSNYSGVPMTTLFKKGIFQLIKKEGN